MSETFGARLATLRQAAHHTKSSLARATGLDHSTISKLEHGDRDPAEDSLHRIVDALQQRLGSEALVLYDIVGRVPPTSDVERAARMVEARVLRRIATALTAAVVELEEEFR